MSDIKVVLSNGYKKELEEGKTNLYQIVVYRKSDKEEVYRKVTLCENEEDVEYLTGLHDKLDKLELLPSDVIINKILLGTFNIYDSEFGVTSRYIKKKKEKGNIELIYDKKAFLEIYAESRDYGEREEGRKI